MAKLLRLGSVSYLNARPLIWGLDRDPGIELVLDVPSRLLDGLCSARYDLALLPVIDYQRAEGLVIVPAGGIGSDGPALTVRIFSRVPIEKIDALACDPDSHTSVALARLVLARRYGVRPEMLDLRRAGERGEGRPAEARLLIGDKVVCDEPVDFPYQLDLGQEWKEMTGLPFVFAVWTAREGVDVEAVYVKLAAARTEGIKQVDRIVAEHAVPRGWPADLARRYLLENLRYEVGEREIEAMDLFWRLAGEEGRAVEPKQIGAWRDRG
jgi:chorismate dehydratase